MQLLLFLARLNNNRVFGAPNRLLQMATAFSASELRQLEHRSESLQTFAGRVGSRYKTPKIKYKIAMLFDRRKTPTTKSIAIKLTLQTVLVIFIYFTTVSSPLPFLPLLTDLRFVACHVIALPSLLPLHHLQLHHYTFSSAFLLTLKLFHFFLMLTYILIFLPTVFESLAK
jgi:hypothetical protein